MLVLDFMTREPAVVSPEDSLLHARTLMRHGNLKHLPVVRAGRLDGIITDRDIRDYMPSRCRSLGLYELGSELADITVGEVMSRHPTVVEPDQPLATAAALMLQHNIGCLPVVSQERLVGVLTSSDVLRMVSRSGHRSASNQHVL